MNTWQSNVRYVTPYVPGEQPDFADMIKLNTNECPYPPSPKVAEAVAGFNEDSLRLYPDPNCRSLTEVIAKRYRVAPEQVFVGVGSDDVLAMAFMTYFNSYKPVLFPDITYSFYDVWAELYRIPYIRIPLMDDFTINEQDYLRENGGIVIANPNAPTGEELPLSKIEVILAANPDSVVIVDEAYVDFGGTSALPLLEKYDNLLVVQTFSKSRAMAGIRIGYAIGSAEMIGCLNNVRNSFNSYTMNRLTLTCGVAAVEDEDYFQEITGKIIKTREKAVERFRALGFTVPDSKANFLFVTHPDVSADELFTALREQHIFVRHWNKERISGHLRVTIGTDEQMDVLFAFLEKYLKERTVSK